MFQVVTSETQSSIDLLAARGYVPAEAARFVRDGKYSRAVELCKEYLLGHPQSISVRLSYARALYHAGQIDTAMDQFYEVLTGDPDNVVALKYLGDIKYKQQDEFGALALYARVLEIDPESHILSCRWETTKPETTHTITITRAAEDAPTRPAAPTRTIHFYTETVADLYMAQGYPRLAAEVYRHLHERNPGGRYRDKLSQAEEKVKEKENAHVKKTD